MIAVGTRSSFMGPQDERIVSGRGLIGFDNEYTENRRKAREEFEEKR
jgi:hypothetical protein